MNYFIRKKIKAIIKETPKIPPPHTEALVFPFTLNSLLRQELNQMKTLKQIVIVQDQDDGLLDYV